MKETFTISRELEYFSEPELTKQIGHARRFWPLVIAKELIDNSLDNCEEHGILPHISVKITGTTITISDNGTGIPASTVEGMLDFSSRISSRDAYRSLSRGAMGNAGKCLLAIPYVLSGGSGSILIDTQGVGHKITLGLDPIEQTPVIDHRTLAGKVNSGTCITVDLACSEPDKRKTEFMLFAFAYWTLNPHLTLEIDIEGIGQATYDRTVDTIGKWSPRDADPAGWHDLESFERLVAACIDADRKAGQDRPLREFVKAFAGLTGSAVLKRIAADTGMHRCGLSSLINCNGLDHSKVATLLEAMKCHGKKPKPDQLGCLGRAHLETAIGRWGGHSGFRYKKLSGIDSRGLPFVVEAGFAEKENGELTVISGVNFSPAIDTPVLRDLDLELLNHEVEDDSAVVCLLHVATVAPNYLDRGKSVVEPDVATEKVIEATIENVLKDYRKKREAERRSDRASQKRFESRLKAASMSCKDAVFRVLEEAVDAVSQSGEYEFSNRELYYIVRPAIQPLTDRELTQSNFDGIVDQWEKEHGLIEGRNRDPRGFLLPPHGHDKIPLGTKEVDDYEIPLHLYNRILYVEKKNILNKIGDLGDKYDMAIMAAEGYSARAGKALLQAAQDGHRMQVFCLHDADPYGYNISRTLSQDSGAHKFDIEVIDLGFTIGEAVALGLETETFTRLKTLPKQLELTALDREYFDGDEENYRGRNGKQKCRWVNCRRIELNALSAYPDRFVAWLEGKLQAHGLTKKLVPPDEVIQSHAMSVRETELTTEIRNRVMGRLGIDRLVDSVTERVIDQLDIGHVAAELKQWGEVLNTSDWRREVKQLIDGEIDDVDDLIETEIDSFLPQHGGDQ